MTLEELYRLLRAGHVQSQGIVDTLQEPLVVLDKALTVVSANPAFLQSFRTDRENTLGQSLFELGNGQWNIPELQVLLAEILPKATAILGYQVKYDFPDLGPRTMLVSARQLVHPDHNSTQILVLFEDVTEREAQSAAKDMLIAETRHRMKNLMAMVRAVASQTDPEGRTGQEYRDIFMGRFEAILNAQDFIASSGPSADLGALINQSVVPLAGPRAVIAPGPAAILTEYQVTPVTMILHELATNAIKYGALSNQTGTVHIGWNKDSVDGRNYLRLHWHEAGGPPVSPPRQRGFGTELIDFSIRAEGGEAQFDFAPSGLNVQLTLLLEQ